MNVMTNVELVIVHQVMRLDG